MASGKYPVNYWKGLAAVLLAYTMNQLLIHLPKTSLPDVLDRLPISPYWFLLAAVYGAGAYVLSQSGVRWIHSLWQITYLTLIAYVFLNIAYVRLFGPMPLRLGSAVRPVIDFLLSPAPYLALGLIYRYAGNKMASSAARPSPASDP
jgi:hypothetical protein